MSPDPPAAKKAAWTSDLSVQEFAALRSVGFEPVGQVMGISVVKFGYDGNGGCGAYPSTYRRGLRTGPTPVVGTGQRSASPWVGFQPLVTALYDVRRRALSRLTQQCKALGGDGVIGVRLRMRPFPGAGDAMEYEAIGTAVRGTGSRHIPQPFTSDLSGQEAAKLLMSGWVPCGIVFGVAVGVRHDDFATQRARRSWGNVEIPGYTELVQQTRKHVRHEISENVVRVGGQGLVARPMRLRIREQECRSSDSNRDHLAEVTMVGTAVVPFRRGMASDVPAPLRILRLDRKAAEAR